MRFDPAADPWGTTMLATAALWLLSLLVLVAALMARTSRRPGGYLMLVSLLAFLGAAVGGTWDRIRQADALVAVAPPSPPVASETSVPVESGAAAGGSAGTDDAGTGEPGTAAGASGGAAEGDGATGGEPTGTAGATTGDASTGPATTSEADTGDATTGDAAAGGSTDDAAAAGSTGDVDPSAGEEPGTDTGDPAEPEPVTVTVPGAPLVPENLPQVSRLPDDPSAREAAIRDVLEDAARAAGGGERCGNLERVARAWARLQTIPVTRKAKTITKDLERCRRRLLYSISQKRLTEMTEARDAWYAKLPTKLRKQHGLIVQSAISGGSHERLRIGNRELDAERADAIMDAGLREDLVRLQFAHVVITNGKKSKTYELPVTPEGELGLPWLHAVGLGEPLKLAE